MVTRQREIELTSNKAEPVLRVKVIGTKLQLRHTTAMRFATHTTCNDLKQHLQIQGCTANRCRVFLNVDACAGRTNQEPESGDKERRARVLS
jgi:hypothetical protein